MSKNGHEIFLEIYRARLAAEQNREQDQRLQLEQCRKNRRKNLLTRLFSSR